LAGQLSGGMRQKLGVIAAMLHQPDLLVLDEPTTGVDPVSRSGLWWLIARAAAAGAAVVLATTYLDEAQRAASVLVLDGGQQLAAGTPAEITAAMPGSVLAAKARPAGAAGPAGRGGAGRRAWRCAGRWRVWNPADAGGDAADVISPDLQDAVTVAALARELVRAGHETDSSRADGAAAAGPGPGPGTDAAARPATDAGPAPSTAARSAAGPLAQCVAVSRQFGQFTAVRGVNLQVSAGEIVGLLGANGAGKTTVIRMLLGLLATSDGEVALFGQPPSRGTRRRIGYLPQGLGLYSDLT